MPRPLVRGAGLCALLLISVGIRCGDLDCVTGAFAGDPVLCPAHDGPRGYQTTPGELAAVMAKADLGIEPYQSAVDAVLDAAQLGWAYPIASLVDCPGSDVPAWNDDQAGTKRLYAKALAYGLTGDPSYAEEVRLILQRIMSEALVITTSNQQCRLNFGWGTPEMVASADLIEDYWAGRSCTGPASTVYGQNQLTTGDCKTLFQNWLVKNPYYVVSWEAVGSVSNWGAAATNAIAHIADYLHDRPDVILVNRNPKQVNGGLDETRSPSEVFAWVNQITLDRMNGYRVGYHSSKACDKMGGSAAQSPSWPLVKSQITEAGIVPDDARRKQWCNVPVYNGSYQNYPQVHLGNNIAQCELMLRRGDPSCFENVDWTDIPAYTFTGPKGNTWTTHLYPGRGSIERAIQAVIVDTGTPWKHDSGLEIAHRYYATHATLPGFGQWSAELGQPAGCSQDACFGTLTHGFAPGETPEDPPTAPAP